MLKRSWCALLLAGAAFLLVTGAAHAVDFVPGAPGLGDPFFPNAGNGGYDVSHYDLTLDYKPSGNQLAGTAAITATATQNLSSFNLDLRGFDIARPARRRHGRLVHARRRARAGDHAGDGHPAGQTFTVTIDYAGTPAVVTDPDESIEGWVPTDDGAFVVNEPQGSPAWYPVNDNPRDKATYDFSVTVPAGLTVMANGVLRSNATANGKTTWVWSETDPMAPYLATATSAASTSTISEVDGHSVVRRRRPDAPEGQRPAQAAGDRPLLRVDLRAVPVQRGR